MIRMQNELPFESDNVDDYTPQMNDPDDMELRTQPKPFVGLNRSSLTIAYVVIFIVAAIIVTYAVIRSMDDDKAQQTENTSVQRNDLNDFYKRLPDNYEDAAAFVKDRVTAEFVSSTSNSESPKEKDWVTSPLGVADTPSDESVALFKKKGQALLDACFELLSASTASNGEMSYCSQAIQSSQQVSMPHSSSPGMPSSGNHTGTSMAPRGEPGLDSPSDEELEAWGSEIQPQISDLASTKNNAGGQGTDTLASLGLQDLALTGLNGPDTMVSAGKPSSQSQKQSFLERNSDADDVYLQQSVITPKSPYQLMAGSTIPIVLTQGINSDLPGDVSAQVRENVYDTVTGRHLLLPQGSRVIGVYDSVISYGQSRVLVVWSRIIRPDGSSISLEGMRGVDMSGFAGVTGNVDNHWGKVISGVVLSSLLSVGTAVSQGDQDNRSFSQDFARAAGADINQSGQKILNRNLGVQPTIVIPPGESANIFVNKDMVLNKYNEKRTYTQKAKRDW